MLKLGKNVGYMSRRDLLEKYGKGFIGTLCRRKAATEDIHGSRGAQHTRQTHCLHEYDDDGRDKACSDGCIPTMRLTFAIVRSLPFGRVRISLSEK